ncbi:MAG TPA: hypothetical protein G4O00_07325 [Thermoflexia bacterium]|nr:hypothetical protein [Thermoflexia bacterium]
MGEITAGIREVRFGSTATGDPEGYTVGDPYPPATNGTLSGESTTVVQVLPPGACPWCSRPSVHHWVFHNGFCPRVRAIDYYPNGSIKRVEFWPEDEDRALAEADLASYALGLAREDEEE